LLKPNVQLVTSPISGILNGKTICTEDGNEYLPDVSILNRFTARKMNSLSGYLYSDSKCVEIFK
jgi:hypothetical protein